MFTTRWSRIHVHVKEKLYIIVYTQLSLSFGIDYWPRIFEYVFVRTILFRFILMVFFDAIMTTVPTGRAQCSTQRTYIWNGHKRKVIYNIIYTFDICKTKLVLGMSYRHRIFEYFFRKIYFSLNDYGVFRCDYADCANREELNTNLKRVYGMALDVISMMSIY